MVAIAVGSIVGAIFGGLIAVGLVFVGFLGYKEYQKISELNELDKMLLCLLI